MYEFPPLTSTDAPPRYDSSPTRLPGPASVGLPPESDTVTAVRRRETSYRRALVIADVVATLAALFVAVIVLAAPAPSPHYWPPA